MSAMVNSNAEIRHDDKLHYVTADGHQRCTVFQNTAAGMSILSTSKLTDEDNLLRFHKLCGYVYHLPANTCTPVVKRLGVCFLKMRVPKELKTDFGRQEP